MSGSQVPELDDTTDSQDTQHIVAETCGEPVRDRSQDGVITLASLCAVTFLFVVMRIVTRCTRGSAIKYGWDDTMLIIAFFCSLSIAIVGGFLFTFGVGRDIWMISKDVLSKLFFVFYLEEISYTVATGAVKVALLAFYIRIFPGQNLRRAAWTAIAFTIAFTLGFVLVAIFQCIPVQYTWHKWDPQYHGTCVEIWKAIMVHAVINIILDLVIISIPMPTLYRLRMSWTNKIQVGLMFCVGFIITIVSALRFYTLRGQHNAENVTWSIRKPALWSAIEVYVSIICACLPATKLLLKQLHQWIQGHGFLQKTGPDHQSQQAVLPREPAQIYKRSSIIVSSMSDDSNTRCSAVPSSDWR